MTKKIDNEIVRFHKDDKGIKFKDLPWHLQEKIRAKLCEISDK